MNPLSLSLSNSEQCKIATFLTLIDQKIENITKIINCFIKIKKYFLNNLFVNKNNKVPTLRFPGFKGEWKEYQIKDIFKITRGKVLSTKLISKTKNKINKYPVYSSQVFNQGILGYYHQYLFEKAITWSTDGTAGEVNYRDHFFYCTNVCGVLISNKYANKTVAIILNKVAKKYVVNSCIPKLMNNVMAKIKIKIPSHPEQIKMASFFTLIDQKIENIKQQKNCLEQYRSYLLKNMFV